MIQVGLGVNVSLRVKVAYPGTQEFVRLRRPIYCQVFKSV